MQREFKYLIDAIVRKHGLSSHNIILKYNEIYEPEISSAYFYRCYYNDVASIKLFKRFQEMFEISDNDIIKMKEKEAKIKKNIHLLDEKYMDQVIQMIGSYEQTNNKIKKLTNDIKD